MAFVVLPIRKKEKDRDVICVCIIENNGTYINIICLFNLLLGVSTFIMTAVDAEETKETKQYNIIQ